MNATIFEPKKWKKAEKNCFLREVEDGPWPPSKPFENKIKNAFFRVFLFFLFSKGLDGGSGPFMHLSRKMISFALFFAVFLLFDVLYLSRKSFPREAQDVKN